MKLIWTFQLALFAVAGSVNAQTILYEDFESYDVGTSIYGQNPTVWTTWSGDLLDGPCILVVGDIVLDTKSGYIPGATTTDCILLLGNRTSGDYTLEWEAYLGAGDEGYFNIQGEALPVGGSGVFNSSNIYYNNGGAAPGVFEDTTTGETGTYPEDAWFTTSIYFDVDALTYEISINGTLVNLTPVPFQADTTLGGINFFTISANNSMWLDNILFVEGVLGNDDFRANNFSIYPNPIIDVLNIRSANVVDAIAIYDVSGKLIIETAPDIISPSINVNTLTSGVYLVKITIGDDSKTVKVVK
jgi:hypothetical protein